MAHPSAKKAPHPHLILGICCLSLLLVAMDVTIVNVALPAIARKLHAALSQLQWIVDAYTLVVAALLMFTGSMSDRFGRKRVFQIGLVMFTLGSAACSAAPTIQALIFFRALQGLGASMLNPVALAIIAQAFPEEKPRAAAMGVWSAVFGIALALGPLVGGALTQAFGWRLIFLINVPIGISAVVLTARYVPESKAPRPRALDPIGQVLIFIALAGLTYAIIEGPRVGWSSAVFIGLLAASFGSLAGFLLYEPRRAEPLLEERFFRSVPFSAASVIALLSFGAFAGFLFLNTLYLQQSRGLSAFHTGLCTLPLAAAVMFCGPLSGRMVGRRGTRPSLLAAGAGMMAGTLLLTGLSPQTPLPLLLGAYAVFGFALGMVNPAISTVAVDGMPRSQTGVAAAVASTSRQVGAALGVAVAGTVVHESRTRGIAFSAATHPIWWAMAACGAAIAVLGWVTNTAWAQNSAQRVAALMQ